MTTRLLQTGVGLLAAGSSGLGRVRTPARWLGSTRLRTIAAKLSDTDGTLIPKQDQGDRSEDAQWLWPATREEMMMAEGHRRGTRWTVLCCRFSSGQPLGHGFMDTLGHAMNMTVRPLRGVVKHKEGQPWMCASIAPLRGVQVMETEDQEEVEETVDELCNAVMSYEKTPLWKLLVAPSIGASCAPLGSLLRYECEAYFRFHRAFMDTESIVYTLSWFVQTIHKMTGGEAVSMAKQRGSHQPRTEVEDSCENIKRYFKSHMDDLDAKKDLLLSYEKLPLLLQAYPAPGGVPATRHVRRCLLPGTIAKFMKHCKMAQVTATSGLEAAINVALVEIVHEAGVKGDSHQVSVVSNSDLRRYLAPRYAEVLGFHEAPVVHMVDTSVSAKQHFWVYARRLDKQLRLLQQSGEDLQQQVVREMTEEHAPSPEDYYLLPPPLLVDYELINAGNLSAVIPGHSKKFSVSEVYFMSSAHSYHYMMSHQMNLYNGVFFYTLSYDSSYVTDNTANLLIDRVVSVMESM